jgi:hypothetical protein
MTLPKRSVTGYSLTGCLTGSGSVGPETDDPESSVEIPSGKQVSQLTGASNVYSGPSQASLRPSS